jgi:hypothetical protein
MDDGWRGLKAPDLEDGAVVEGHVRRDPVWPYAPISSANLLACSIWKQKDFNFTTVACLLPLWTVVALLKFFSISGPLSGAVLSDGGGGSREQARVANHAPSNDSEEPESIEGRVPAGGAWRVARRPLAAC